MKTCSSCKVTKPYTDYSPSGRLNNKSYCKVCNAAYVRACRKKDPAKFRKRNNDQTKKLKDIVQKAYGSKCVCCGETNGMFLSIDHINNDGSKQREKLYGHKKGGASATHYTYIIKNNFPCDLQLLCYNCNMGKKINKGICPHKV